jgi:hypothetical protein
MLQQWDRRPPPFAILMATTIVLAIALALGPVGRRIAESTPLWALIGVQSFRLPLELAMHSMYERGIMPAQMSYSGRNFDILTGASAIVVAALVFVKRGSNTLVLLWNILGLALLLNVLGVAFLSTPMIGYFGVENLNTWVADPPFVWLPCVMVLAALAGHLIIFRASNPR